MQKRKAISVRYRIIPLALAVVALLCSCADTLPEKPQEIGGGYEEFENSESEGKGGTLTVTASVSTGASRHAMPSIPDLVYAALLYKDGESPENPESKDFAQGTKTENGKLIFSFQRPDDTDGTFTLEVFAFIKADVVAEDGTTNFSKNNAPFSKAKKGLAIVGDAINVSEIIVLEVNDSSDLTGTVSLKIKVPEGCLLEIDDTTSDGETRFKKTQDGDDSNTYIVSANGISAGAYPLTFTVKKGSEIVHIFSEYINVINGLCTDTWSGLAKDEAKDIANSISKTVYVRGTGGWYTSNAPSTEANDANSGSFLSPLATIQKAIDKIIAINDGTSIYTICVDGTLECADGMYTGTNGMADFSKLDNNLNLAIKALSGTATLDGGAQFDENGTATDEGIKKRVINAKPGTGGTLNLTLENLVITGGYGKYIDGGGIYIGANSEVTISGDTMISKNTTIYNVLLGGNGGGIYVSSSGKLTMEGGTISGNSVERNGGGIYVNGGTFTMTGGTITDNTASRGGGLYVNAGTFTMTGSTISGNTATANGGGVYVEEGAFTMTGGTTISGNTASNDGGGVYVYDNGTFTMTGGKIGEENAANTAQNGGGVYVNGGAFNMSGGTVSKNKAVGDSENSGGGGIYVYKSTFEMSGGTFSGNEAENGKGHGAFISPDGGILKMSGSAQFADDNDIYLHTYTGATLPTVQIADDLATSLVATITLSAYTAGTQVLSGAAATLAANCGKFEVSEAGWKIDEEGKLAVAPDIYVSEGGDDTNGKGSQTKPFATLQKAFDLIQTLNLSAVSYIVHISGTVKGKSELFDGVSAQKISITGTTGAKLDGNKCLSWLLTISCSAPVEITNVTLTNSWDGGLYVKNGADVTLGEGAAISKNSNITSGGLGGGVRNEGKFTMKSNAKISENYMTGDRDPGGGVYSKGTFIMEGGEISGNYTSTSYSTGYGGGVCIAGGTFEMTGGTISGNRASSAGKGGGVYVSSGTFTMGGSASIPAGDDGKNDVYLASGKKITVASGLAAEIPPVATITLSAYTAGKQVLSAASGTITQDICDKFALSDEDWKIVSDGTNGVLKAKINVYVRGSGEGWYTDNGHDDITGSDSNSGDRLHPFATIQKAVTAVKDLNDGETECTIFVDGTVTQETSSSSAMVDLQSLSKNLTLTIKSLSETKRATLDANKLTKLVYVKSSNIDLAIKNLILCKGKDTNYGLYFSGQNVTAKFVVSGCEISGNESDGIDIWNAGTFAIENCEIINNSGGGYAVRISSRSSGTITGSKIKDNIYSRGTAGLYVENSELTIKDCEISGNTSTFSGSCSGGIELYDGGSGCTLTMEDCIVSGNSASKAGGVYLNSGSFTMKGSKSKISGNRTTGTSKDGGGVYVNSSTFTMENGEISGNEATGYGGGVYVGGNGSFIMNGGKITGNTATEKGGGVYVKTGGTFTQGGTVSGNTVSGSTPDDVYKEP